MKQTLAGYDKQDKRRWLFFLFIMLTIIMAATACIVGYNLGNRTSKPGLGRIIDTIVLDSKGGTDTTSVRLALSGKVVYNDDTPFAFGTVELHSRPRTAVTDEQGFFCFHNTEQGEHSLSIVDASGNILATTAISLSKEGSPDMASLEQNGAGEYEISVPPDMALVKVELTIDEISGALTIREDSLTVITNTGTVVTAYGSVNSFNGPVMTSYGIVVLPDYTIVIPNSGIILSDGSFVSMDGSVELTDGTVIKNNEIINLPNGEIVAADNTTLTLSDNTVIDLVKGETKLPNGTVVNRENSVSPKMAESEEILAETPTPTFAGRDTPVITPETPISTELLIPSTTPLPSLTQSPSISPKLSPTMKPELSPAVEINPSITAEVKDDIPENIPEITNELTPTITPKAEPTVSLTPFPTPYSTQIHIPKAASPVRIDDSGNSLSEWKEPVILADSISWTQVSTIELFDMNIGPDMEDDIGGKIYPGVEGYYGFEIYNPNTYAVKFDMKIEDAVHTAGSIPFIYRLIKVTDIEDIYIAGDETTWLSAEDLATIFAELDSGERGGYILEWKWPYEGNDEHDTALGTDALSDHYISITIHVEQK